MTIEQILKYYWQHNAFRPLQKDIIEAVMQGQDTLALLPTGGGKSVCYQVPAMAMDGICIVVSPLIALMKDQVDNLQSKGIEAVAIVSGMGKREVDIALDNCIYGPVKFLYLSPERLLSDLVRERIKYMKVNLIAVDEAHCISQWGYDFRPPYLHVADLRQLHPKVPVLALTATATANVRDDIQDKLQFRARHVIQQSFERKNLSYRVQHEENKLRRMLEVARSVNGSGIVYVRNRKETTELAKFFNDHGIAADHYHAGLSGDRRSAKQEQWKSNHIRIIVATNAFGMGIDKPDVRFVIHKDLPESLEAYYQEAGRAGRDGQKAYAILLYNQSDRQKQEYRFEVSFPSVDEIKQVYHYLANYYQLAYGAGEGLSFDLDLADLCSRFKLDVLKTLNALKFLEHGEYLNFNESVFLPSRFRFEVEHEELYNFQIQNPAWDPFIKTMLRSYGGAFEHYTRIREFDLARRTNLSVQQVTEALQQLNDLGVLSYLPQTDKPQVTYLKPRHTAANLWIDRQYLDTRRLVYQKKMEAILAYSETDRCRSQQLLAYFNEPDAEKCGVCDVCLREKRRNDAPLLHDRIRDEILQLLSTSPLDLEQLISGIAHGKQPDRLTVLRQLLDAGRIKTTGNKYYL
ncbi:RecQ family ATP-dependent DNA helicase [Mucilaginibacter daejeonensis]|uniref:RecQ family ATP-dependent DNA helicase n=1 Tax=Mucilaginibacter daejeonensis TaxID=398049 RepID=UPI001D1793F2|nr:ATP-dependent DNA helicase RecQ [Mucilaginibacter daejeonensis]UEG51805.1 RecQ family ATP-dependent DNA helicase [Mucilaginibacter daejeonensis]